MLDTGLQNTVLSEAAANRLGIVRDARFETPVIGIGGGSAMTDTGLRQRYHRSTILGAARHPGTSGNVVPRWSRTDEGTRWLNRNTSGVGWMTNGWPGDGSSYLLA